MEHGINHATSDQVDDNDANDDDDDDDDDDSDSESVFSNPQDNAILSFLRRAIKEDDRLVAEKEEERLVAEKEERPAKRSRMGSEE